MGVKTQEELNAVLVEAKNKVKVGGKYTHFKSPDKIYTVLEIGFIEDTEEPCVIYKAEYGENLVWVRTIDNWLALKETEKGLVRRFQEIQD